MSNMQAFYRKLHTPVPAASHLPALLELTRTDVKRVKAAATDLWWSDWTSPVVEGVRD